MNAFRFLFWASVIFFSDAFNQAIAQTERGNRLSLTGGIQHITLLDRQASPVVYEAKGPGFGLSYSHLTTERMWQVSLYGGQYGFQPAREDLQYYDTWLSGISAGVSASYLRQVRQWEKSNLWLGAALNEEMVVDFESIGNWPYVLAQGGIYVTSQWNYQVSPGHQFAARMSLPLLPWLTDMPYQQIPRTEGRAPDVVSAFKEGSRLAFWNSFQKVDISVSYEFTVSTRWVLTARYDWAWFHDAQPKDIWAYQGSLRTGATFKF